MLIKTITENAEKFLLKDLESEDNNSLAKSTVLCSFFANSIKQPPVSDFVLMLKDILSDKSASVFFCKDGDVFIEWSGNAKETLSEIKRIVVQYCKNKDKNFNESKFFRYFDFNADGEELRVICNNKIAAGNEKIKKPVEVEKTSEVVEKIAEFTSEQLSNLKRAVLGRDKRSITSILIVEDQVFSQKLILGLLSAQYKCFTANTGVEALEEYSQHAPDIVFLDIELPDISGHSIASFLRKNDPDAFIVMVTGNNYVKDVEKAKANKVQGFIAKPYNKQKIISTIENYHKTHK